MYRMGAKDDIEAILGRLGLDPETALGMIETELYAAQRPYGWDNYKPSRKHIEFIENGISYAVRALIAGNQLGKTMCTSFELACHLMNRYPPWWNGKRYNRPVRAWACGVTATDVRDTIQKYLLGDIGQLGTGFIPGDMIDSVSSAHGTADAVDTVTVRTVNGGVSRCTFKSYAQGRLKFQGETLDIALMDEEPPADIDAEIRTRLNTTKGIALYAFTPLKGRTELYRLLTKDPPPGTRVTHMTIDDADHLDSELREDIKRKYSKTQGESRLYGRPGAGSGLVFDIDPDYIMCEPFRIPAFYRCIGGMDFGWDHPAAAVCLAHDPDSDVIYVCREFRARQNTPLQIAAAVKPWGSWLPWAWPHDGHASGGKFDRQDQKQLHIIFKDHGLKMLPNHATFLHGGNGVEAGLSMMYERMSAGTFKVFDNCTGYMDEVESYYRDEGELVKLNDDLISASRYAFMMLRFATIKQANENSFHLPPLPTYTRLTGPMG